MDVLRAITIILVVVGHSGFPFTNFIYLFHITLFFFISGYFFKDEYVHQPITFIKKRIRSLYLPFVGYSLAFLSLHNVFYKLNFYSNKISYAKNFVINLYTPADFIYRAIRNIKFIETEQLLGAFWFLPCLFSVSIMFLLICLISKYVFQKYSEYAKLLLVVLCFAFGTFASQKNVQFFFYGDIALVAVLIYYFGYLYRRYEKYIQFKPYYLVPALLILLFSSFHGHIEMSLNKYPNMPFFIYNSLAGIYLSLYVAKHITNKGIIRLFSFIGIHTIAILALHFLSFKLINFIQLTYFDYHIYPLYLMAIFPTLNTSGIWWVAYTLAGIGIPLFFIFSLDQIKLCILRLYKHS